MIFYSNAFYYECYIQGGLVIFRKTAKTNITYEIYEKALIILHKNENQTASLKMMRFPVLFYSFLLVFPVICEEVYGPLMIPAEWFLVLIMTTGIFVLITNIVFRNGWKKRLKGGGLEKIIFSICSCI